MLTIINKPYVWVIVFLCGWMLPSDALAQKKVDEYNGEPVYILVENLPQYPGGEEELDKYFKKNIVYQKKSQPIEGKVYVQFYVTKTGELVNVSIQRGIREDIDAEVIRVIRNMPKWIPANQGGQPVHMLFKIPVKIKSK